MDSPISLRQTRVQLLAARERAELRREEIELATSRREQKSLVGDAVLVVGGLDYGRVETQET